MRAPDDAISSESFAYCECCERRRLCRMYVLQDGRAAFVCKPCRTGKKENGE